ncbi:hypothetical protein BASA50_007968 [Batrachochytrium salamandrivorans]|uniref:RNA polymerase II-associated factor 1 homolog n=1 Tax=Batrachochytrium salamandrivorans TaxID=1357716 RepID=A0ABQ8F5H9_9FUNG|nr:hypothetical protein BASA60_006782 [Batrachochytrium salamandrivorans]KAH6592592.1 hypothetical protein BASA50_007968 [Batrachochytrium salamandrivorans]
MATPKRAIRDFALKVAYRNALPDIPFDPKLLEHPFPEDRHYRYTTNSLYASTPYHVYTADDENGLPLNMLAQGYLENAFRNPHAKRPLPNPDGLDLEDRALLVRPTDVKLASATATASGEVTRMRPIVPWLRRTEYVGVEGKTFGRRADTGIETKMGVSIRQDKRLNGLMDRTKESQMDAIANTFETAAAASLSNLKHPTNPDLKPLEIFPIYPDFEFWPNQYRLVTYDDDPINRSQGGQGQYAPDDDGAEYEHDLKLESAIIKPMQNPDDETDVTMVFFTPTDSSAAVVRERREHNKRLFDEGLDVDEDDDGKILEYEYRRDFEESLSKSSYPFYIELRTEEGGAFYSKLPKRISLRKKRATNKNERAYDPVYDKPTKILVSHREFHPDELAERDAKMEDLLQRKEIDDE